VKLHLRDSGVSPSGEDIVKDPPDCSMDTSFGIDIGRSLLYPVKSPDVIKTENMVHMFVGEEDCPEVFYVMGKHLLPEIRTCIDQEIITMKGDQGRSAQPFVTRIIRPAHWTVASDEGDAL